MKKSEAIALLGGSVTAAAERCGISSAAVSQWPDDETGDLPKNIVDRVQAALYRSLPAELREQVAAPTAADEHEHPVCAPRPPADAPAGPIHMYGAEDARDRRSREREQHGNTREKGPRAAHEGRPTNHREKRG